MPYEEEPPPKATPLFRWFLAPVMLLFAGVFFIPLLDAVREQRPVGVIATAMVITFCIAGALTIFSVPFVSRIASAVIALAFGWYLVDQCFISFDGSWGFGGSRSGATPINSILGFLFIGLPSLIYTILGRFTLRRDDELEGPSGEVTPDGHGYQQKGEQGGDGDA